MKEGGTGCDSPPPGMLTSRGRWKKSETLRRVDPRLATASFAPACGAGVATTKPGAVRPAAVAAVRSLTDDMISEPKKAGPVCLLLSLRNARGANPIDQSRGAICPLPRDG